PFGFLYAGADHEHTVAGNAGFYDQLLALQWVRDNIHLFGGDKDMVTIFGQSAGSWSVSAHVLSPLSKGLFKRAIMSSGAHMYSKRRDIVNKTDAVNMAKQLARDLNCDDHGDWVDCLRMVDAHDLVKSMTPLTFPVLGTGILPLSAAEAFEQNVFNSDIDLLAGVSRDEGPLLAKVSYPDVFGANITMDKFMETLSKLNKVFHDIPEQNVGNYYANNVNNHGQLSVAFGKLYGDLFMNCPTYVFAKQFAKNSQHDSTYFYMLTFKSKMFAMFNEDDSDESIHHGDELAFVFGHPLMDQQNYTETDYDFSIHVMEMWTNFAKNGLEFE
ncbi:unnamed protein product, partial [Medioppia subpectinata]